MPRIRLHSDWQDPDVQPIIVESADDPRILDDLDRDAVRLAIQLDDVITIGCIIAEPLWHERVH